MRQKAWMCKDFNFETEDNIQINLKMNWLQINCEEKMNNEEARSQLLV